MNNMQQASKYLHPFHPPTAGVALAFSALLAVAGFYPTPVNAGIVYDEGFAYGSSAGSLAGQNGGSGFSGAWTSGNPGITYAPAGLSFSDLSVSGGMITASGFDGIGNALFYRPMGSTLNGVYYGSFLSQVVAASASACMIGMTLGPANSFPGEFSYGILAPLNASALGTQVPFATQASGSTLNSGQPYLTLFKIDTAARTIAAWVLSAAQFDNFKLDGIMEAELNGATVGVSGSQVWGRATITSSFSITASYLNLYMNAPGGVSATLVSDQFRLSNTSLDEVIPVVPEPDSAALFLGGLSLLAIGRKRAKRFVSFVSLCGRPFAPAPPTSLPWRPALPASAAR